MAADPYASHIPFLRNLGDTTTSVLELGAGKYSTPLFLNREAYPMLTHLLTVEHDRKWAMSIEPDARLTLAITSDPVQFLTRLRLSDYDFIFVDNGADGDWQSREAVIRYLAERTLYTAVIIHDFEYEPYQVAASGFAHVEVDKTLTPWTAMCWND